MCLWGTTLFPPLSQTVLSDFTWLPLNSCHLLYSFLFPDSLVEGLLCLTRLLLPMAS